MNSATMLSGMATSSVGVMPQVVFSAAWWALRLCDGSLKDRGVLGGPHGFLEGIDELDGLAFVPDDPEHVGGPHACVHAVLPRLWHRGKCGLNKTNHHHPSLVRRHAGKMVLVGEHGKIDADVTVISGGIELGRAHVPGAAVVLGVSIVNGGEEIDFIVRLMSRERMAEHRRPFQCQAVIGCDHPAKEGDIRRILEMLGLERLNRLLHVICLRIGSRKGFDLAGEVKKIVFTFSVPVFFSFSLS